MCCSGTSREGRNLEEPLEGTLETVTYSKSQEDRSQERVQLRRRVGNRKQRNWVQRRQQTWWNENTGEGTLLLTSVALRLRAGDSRRKAVSGIRLIVVREMYLAAEMKASTLYGREVQLEAAATSRVVVEVGSPAGPGQ
jgi:hypothetical protein